MYEGPSVYLAERAQRRKTECEYWNAPHLKGAEGPTVEPQVEVEIVRNAIQEVQKSMKSKSVWNEDEKCYCMAVSYDWRKAGAFCEGPKGVI